MKRNVFFRAVLRRPAQTLLLLLLVALLTALFAARAMEYAIVQNETERIGEYYQSVGRLEPDDPEEYNAILAAEQIDKSDLVAFEDKRHASAANLIDLYNADVDGWSSDRPESTYSSGLHISDVFLYGEPLSIDSTQEGLYHIRFSVDQALAAYPEYAEDGDIVDLYYDSSADTGENPFLGMSTGKHYLIKAYFNPSFDFGIGWDNAGSCLYLKQLQDDGVWFLGIEDGTVIGQALSAYPSIQEEIDLLDENQRAVMVLSTKDMSAMPRTQQSMRYYYLDSGRYLTRDDDLNQNYVCVVHKEFAALRGLAVGDTIRLRFRNMTCNLLGYLLDGESSVGWKDFPTQEAEFTIVGTYGMLASQLIQPTSRNVVLFIPDSCMPEGYGGDLTTMLPSDQYSFVLKSSEDQAAFVEENQQALSNLGFTLLFADSNAENFWSTVTPMTRTLLTNSVVWGLALAAAMVLAAALYLWQRRKEYAISRALGMPIKRANKQMLLPMLLMGMIAIPIGGVLSWRFAIWQAQQMLASIQTPDGVTPTAAISPAWLIVFCAAVFCVLLVCLFIGTRIVARTPVLNLLQGPTVAVRRRESKLALASATPLARSESVEKGDMLQPTLHENKKAVTSRVVRFIFRNCCRSGIKFILGIGVACLFTCALFWLAMTISQNRAEIDRLYDTTVVEAEIVKQIPSMTAKGTGGGIIKGGTVDEILASGAIESDYLEAAAEWVGIAADGSTTEMGEADSVTLLAFDQPEEFFADSGAKASVEYAEGWDADLFTQSWTQESLQTAVPVVLSSGMMQELNRSLLDTVSLYGDDAGTVVIDAVIAGAYTGTIQTQDTSEPVLTPLSLLETLENLRGREPCYSTARFSIDPKMNRELSSLTERMKSIVESEDAGYLALDFVCWDEELTQAIAPMEKNLQLMNTLYPVSLGLSVLIAAGLSVLLTLLNRKEAAILRVLGMPKRRVRIVLCGQQLLPGLLGVVLGILIALLVWKSAIASSGAAVLLAAGCYLAGLLLGTIGTAHIVARKMPLSLLQARE